MGAGSDARSYVGGNTLPLAVVFLGERLELDAAPGQDVVLASAGLPYLGRDHTHTRTIHTTIIWRKQEYASM